MPAIYPPIAPRGPSAANPDPPTDSFNLDVRAIVSRETEEAGQLERLAALEARPTSFVDAHHPIRDATAIALQKPAGELIERYRARTSPDIVSRETMPAILAMAESQVALALLGDAKAFSAIADRVEGKAGLRKADVDAETEAQRLRVRQTIEELVRDMGERRRIASDDAQIVDVDIVSRET